MKYLIAAAAVVVIVCLSPWLRLMLNFMLHGAGESSKDCAAPEASGKTECADIDGSFLDKTTLPETKADETNEPVPSEVENAAGNLLFCEFSGSGNAKLTVKAPDGIEIEPIGLSIVESEIPREFLITADGNWTASLLISTNETVAPDEIELVFTDPSTGKPIEIEVEKRFISPAEADRITG
ncbi:MAG: hypothetical protein SOZ09_09990 [Eubacteriales bacterium]|nr:hypothetical protein [Eubacteriales bacterium]